MGLFDKFFSLFKREKDKDPPSEDKEETKSEESKEDFYDHLQDDNELEPEEIAAFYKKYFNVDPHLDSEGQLLTDDKGELVFREPEPEPEPEQNILEEVVEIYKNKQKNARLRESMCNAWIDSKTGKEKKDATRFKHIYIRLCDGEKVDLNYDLKLLFIDQLDNMLNFFFPEKGGILNYKDNEIFATYCVVGLAKAFPSGELQSVLVSFKTGNNNDEILLEIYREYHENGQLAATGQSIDDKKEGLCKFYWNNGNLKSTGNAKNDNKDGIWKYYNEDGTLKEEKTYQDGKEITKS